MNGSNIDKIENLQETELVDLVSSLLVKIGYSATKQITSQIFTGTTSSALSVDTHHFLVTSSKLSGAAVDFNDIDNKIQSIRKDRVSAIFLISKFYISEGFKEKLKDAYPQYNINYIDRETIIQLVDKNNPGYWRHSDNTLLDYEKAYAADLLKESQLKKLPIFNDKYDKVLNIFIEPRIYLLYQEPDTNTALKKKVTIEQIIKSPKPALITGDAGTGKSTSLKKIGEEIIASNKQEDEKKSLPVFFSVVEIFDANYDIEKLLSLKLSKNFGEITDNFYTSYNLTILLDSIDELEGTNQKRVVDQLKNLFVNRGVKFIIGTRNDDKLQIRTGLADIDSYRIERFNQDQVKRFIFLFFTAHEGKAEKLIDALKDNRILEKLPLTPLALSLISILFEENNLEIPATITDIFDNFNALLIGRATVSSRIEFIDASFKERILSIYAYHLLNRPEHSPLTKDEFLQFFKDYFEEKTIPLKKGTLNEALDYLIESTGILILKNGKYVKFSHDSFMEYYSAVEVFKHKRDDEKNFVDNFFENNWQNAAIFYAGKSKDMPKFLSDINAKLESANKLSDLYSAVMGAGYILQALYQTDNKLRRNVVLQSIDLNIKINEILSKIFSDETIKLKSYKMPILGIFNIMYFYESFNSSTLREPLKLAFSLLFDDYIQSKKTISGYKALLTALTLDSRRIKEVKELEKLIFDSNLTNEPTLVLLADFFIDMMKGSNYDTLKKELKKEVKRLREPVKSLTSLPVSKLRFSALDPIRLDKKIKIITEGKTDAEILEHAFMVITDGELPYWEILPVGKEEGGGASKLRDALRHTISDPEQETLIAIFDHDSAGLQHYKGLQFPELHNNTVSKHKTENFYAICLPVPGEMQHYLIKEQSMNFFEIEHYFDLELLTSQDMTESTAIPNVYKIREKKKSSFVKIIKKITDPKVFHNFKLLFETIDQITGVDINYNC